MNNIDKFFDSEPTIFAQKYLEYIQTVVRNIDSVEVGQFIELLLAARERDAAIFFIGNGGSAATASHFANDIAVGTNTYEKPFRAVSLVDNVAILTAIGNDYGYDEIFARQLRIQAKKRDVLVGISASGNSMNLVEAFEYARANQIDTVALTGFDGGKLRSIADHTVHVPTEMKEYGPSEDAHMILDHLVGSYLTRKVLSERTH